MIIPANQGWFVLRYQPKDECADERVYQNEIIAWSIGEEEDDMPQPITYDGYEHNVDVVGPNGRVYGASAEEYDSVQEWAENERALLTSSSASS